MNTRLLSEKALFVINQYKNFNVGFAVCSIPYYNNRHMGLRGGLKAQVGKGSPEDISEELMNVAKLQKINLKAIDSITLKKMLVDNNIGIDCSGFAYYILEAESENRGKGKLKRHIFFINARSLFRKFRSKMQPEKNTDVATLTDNKNSRVIEIKDAVPGDMITMVGGVEGKERDHVLVIHQVDFKDAIPTVIYYTHAVAWPTDGEYGHGVRQGVIRINNPDKNIIEQEWIEDNKTGNDNYTFTRSLKSKTEIRRLNWL